MSLTWYNTSIHGSKDMFGILASSFSSKEKVVLNETKEKKKKKTKEKSFPLWHSRFF